MTSTLEFSLFLFFNYNIFQLHFDSWRRFKIEWMINIYTRSNSIFNMAVYLISFMIILWYLFQSQTLNAFSSILSILLYLKKVSGLHVFFAMSYNNGYFHIVHINCYLYFITPFCTLYNESSKHPHTDQKYYSLPKTFCVCCNIIYIFNSGLWL